MTNDATERWETRRRTPEPRERDYERLHNAWVVVSFFGWFWSGFLLTFVWVLW